MTIQPDVQPAVQHDMVVIGAGFSGIAMTIAAKAAGRCRSNSVTIIPPWENPIGTIGCPDVAVSIQSSSPATAALTGPCSGLPGPLIGTQAAAPPEVGHDAGQIPLAGPEAVQEQQQWSPVGPLGARGDGGADRCEVGPFGGHAAIVTHTSRA